MVTDQGRCILLKVFTHRFTPVSYVDIPAVHMENL